MQGKAFRFIFTNTSVLGEPSLNVVVVYDFFFESVSATFWRFHHLNNLGVVFTTTGLQGCNYLLSHGISVLFDFFVYSHTLQDRVVLLLFQPVRRVFAIFCGDIAASAGKTGLLVLCALHDHLNSVAFFSHCLKFLNGAANVQRILTSDTIFFVTFFYPTNLTPQINYLKLSKPNLIICISALYITIPFPNRLYQYQVKTTHSATTPPCS